MYIQKNGPTRIVDSTQSSSSVLQQESYLPRLSHLYISKYLQFQYSTREISLHINVYRKMDQPVSAQSLAVLLLCTVGEQRWACSVAASCSVQHCVRDMVAPSLFCECLSTIAGEGGDGGGGGADDGMYSYCRGEALQQAAAVQAGGPASAAVAALREGTPSQAPRPLLCTRRRRRLPLPHRLLLCTTTLPPKHNSSYGRWR